MVSMFLSMFMTCLMLYLWDSVHGPVADTALNHHSLTHCSWFSCSEVRPDVGQAFRLFPQNSVVPRSSYWIVYLGPIECGSWLQLISSELHVSWLQVTMEVTSTGAIRPTCTCTYLKYAVQCLVLPIGTMIGRLRHALTFWWSCDGKHVTFML